MNIPVIEELCAFTGLTQEEIWNRLNKGIMGTAESFRSCADPEEWYRTTDAYLFELANYDEDPFRSLLANMFSNMFQEKHGVVLEYGCGIGTFAIMLAEKGLRVTACDINIPNREFLKFRVMKRNLSNQVEVTTPDHALSRLNYYMLVSCQHVLEHVENPTLLLSKMRDALIPGGVFCGIAPFDLLGEEFPEHRPEHAHLRLEKLCEEVGFIGIQTMPFGNIGEYVFTLVAAVKP